MTQYILNYNNYYNRLVKKFDTLKEYKSYVVHKTEKMNFNPNDGVQTLQSPVGNATNPYDGSGDYVIIADELDNIISRWFITEATRTKGGQWAITLQRDLVADYYNIIVQSPCFIEKATLKSTDPFVFNTENITTNQIKKAEYPLKDYSNCSWIVGYIDSNYLKTDSPLADYQITSEIPFESSVEYDGSVEDFINFFKLQNSSNGKYKVRYIQPNSLQFSLNWLFSDSRVNRFYGTYYDGENFYLQRTDSDRQYVNQWDAFCGFDPTKAQHYLSTTGRNNPTTAAMLDALENVSNFKSIYEANYKNYEGFAWSYFPGVTDFDTFETLLIYLNKTIKFTKDGITKYYKLTIGDFFNDLVTTEIADYSDGPLSDMMASNLGMPLTGQLNFATCRPNIRATINDFSFNLTEITDIVTDIIFELPRPLMKLSDAPYTMFAIPYNKDGTTVTILDTDSGNTYDNVPVNNNASWAAAQALIKKLQAGAFLYDVQLLPYCPVPRIFEFSSNNKFMGMTLNNEQYYKDVTLQPKSFCRIMAGGSNPSGLGAVSYIFFASASDFSVNINAPNIKIQNKKLENQTDMYRLVSPNYNGQFEFNMVKNDGLKYFNIDCTYKPYTPYIHVNPDFGGLYGQDFNDSRGLICNGDFSLATITDQWRTYEINNKNYQNIFDRSIQNLEIKNDVSQTRDALNMISGTVRGGIQGAMTGLSVGGGNLSAAGAAGVAGAAGGLFTGYGNAMLNEMLRAETINYEIDNFGYKLGNIQALPQSISKTTALTYNNKIFPILEYYSCTDEEKIAVANKIAYNGMTVMRIGTINEFINNKWSYYNEEYDMTINSQNYIKGQLIRLEGLGDDFHVSNAIAAEINKGLYFKEVSNVN